MCTVEEANSTRMPPRKKVDILKRQRNSTRREGNLFPDLFVIEIHLIFI
jgi:hypothetical protein